MTNPYEDGARRKKAWAIAFEIELGYRLLDTWDRLDGSASELAERVTGQRARDVIAEAADQKSPSEQTWREVVEILEMRERDETTATV